MSILVTIFSIVVIIIGIVWMFFLYKIASWFLDLHIGGLFEVFGLKRKDKKTNS